MKMNETKSIPEDVLKKFDARRAIDAVVDLTTDLLKAEQALGVARKPFGEIQKFTDYELLKVETRGITETLQSKRGYNSYLSSVSTNIDHYQKMLDRDVLIVPDNLAVATNNREIYQKIKD